MNVTVTISFTVNSNTVDEAIELVRSELDKQQLDWILEDVYFDCVS